MLLSQCYLRIASRREKVRLGLSRKHKALRSGLSTWAVALSGAGELRKRPGSQEPMMRGRGGALPPQVNSLRTRAGRRVSACKGSSGTLFTLRRANEQRPANRCLCPPDYVARVLSGP